MLLLTRRASGLGGCRSDVCRDRVARSLMALACSNLLRQAALPSPGRYRFEGRKSPHSMTGMYACLQAYMPTCRVACRPPRARRRRAPGSNALCSPKRASIFDAATARHGRTASRGRLRRAYAPRERRAGVRDRRPPPETRDAAGASCARPGRLGAQATRGTSIRSASSANAPSISRAARPRSSVSGTPRRAASCNTVRFGRRGDQTRSAPK